LDPRDPDPPVRSVPTWLRYSSLGVELGATIALPTLLGLWIDRSFGTKPWFFLVGFLLGLAAGLTQFIRKSLSAVRDADRERRDDDEASGSTSGRP
jgi:F0F1-type ATP synthase assembly protein I